MPIRLHQPEVGCGAAHPLPNWVALAIAIAMSMAVSVSSAQTLGQSTPARIEVAEAKPSIKPTAAKPTPAALAEVVPPTAAPEPSALGGAWKVNWIRLNKVTNLNIAGEKPQPGIVGFDSLVGNLAGVDCKGSGFAARTLGGVFPAGGDVNMVGVADYVRITTQCPSGQVWVEALGVAGKPVQWVGRAVLIDASGARSFESVVLTR